MKKVLEIWLLVVLLATTRQGRAQGFINLDFESAKVISDPTSPYYPYGIQTTNALPGWTVSLGGSQQTQITYNALSVGSTWVNLVATNVDSWSPYSGNFSVLLQGGFSLSAATISQTGLIPVGAESLLFEAQPGVGNFSVSLGGQNLSFFALSVGANYTLYGADISAFAGQTEQLAFSALRDVDIPNNWNVDNIQFSSSAVPEPGVLSLLGLGGAVLAWQRRKLM